MIELGIDTMVMDNDAAECRQRVKPTYKKKKGFQPLQMNWGRLIVDVVFRGGDKHSNHGITLENLMETFKEGVLSASVHEKIFKPGYCRSKNLNNRRTDGIDNWPGRTGQPGRSPGPF